jgi:hypothetical protein
MPFDSILWDLDDDPNGNVWHCAEHGISKDEVEDVLQSPNDADVSRSSGPAGCLRRYPYRPAFDGGL